MKLDRACLLFINFAARLFGAMALLAGIVFLVSAYAIKSNRAMDVVAGIFAIVVGVAVFMEKPITIEHLTLIRRRMGGPE